MTTTSRRASVAAVFAAALLAAGQAPASAQVQQPSDLAWASIEELMDIAITSASRKEETASATPAAVFVITQDDIRRSGMSTLPEVLRLVPGAQVAQVNSSNWAISIRGFNDLFANKLLVLVDGVSRYNRTFTGVFWSFEDLLLDDIEQIEVVRGPGSAAWGANAVNGVINIVTKKASKTQGGLVKIGGGSDGTIGVARFGGAKDNTSYRVFTKWGDYRETTTASGAGARDDWNQIAVGARLDRTGTANTLMATASFTSLDSHPLWSSFASLAPGTPVTTDEPTQMRGGQALVRWTHTRPGGAVVEAQSFATTFRGWASFADVRTTVADGTLDYRSRLGTRHDVIIGTGVRYTRTDVAPSLGLSTGQRRNAVSGAGGFAQDEMRVTDRLRVLAGARLEYDGYGGWNLQPTLRGHLDVARGQSMWAATSRAVRTPSLLDRSAVQYLAPLQTVNGQLVALKIVGNPDYRSERLTDVELGYRVDVNRRASIDLTLFGGRYNGLATLEPLAPAFETTPGPPHVALTSQRANLLDLNTSGIEIAARWHPLNWWRVDGSYSGLRITPKPRAESSDSSAAETDAYTPQHQWQLHSGTRLNSRTDLNLSLYRVGAIRTLEVPAYARLDAQLEVRLADHLSAIAVGRNLTDPSHGEFTNAPVVAASTRIPRTARFDLRWSF